MCWRPSKQQCATVSMRTWKDIIPPRRRATLEYSQTRYTAFFSLFLLQLHNAARSCRLSVCVCTPWERNLFPRNLRFSHVYHLVNVNMLTKTTVCPCVKCQTVTLLEQHESSTWFCFTFILVFFPSSVFPHIQFLLYITPNHNKNPVIILTYLQVEPVNNKV